MSIKVENQMAKNIQHIQHSTPMLFVTHITAKLFATFKANELADFAYDIFYSLVNCVRHLRKN